MNNLPAFFCAFKGNYNVFNISAFIKCISLNLYR
jgi:hypothetical protein